MYTYTFICLWMFNFIHLRGFQNLGWKESLDNNAQHAMLSLSNVKNLYPGADIEYVLILFHYLFFA